MTNMIRIIRAGIYGIIKIQNYFNGRRKESYERINQGGTSHA